MSETKHTPGPWTVIPCGPSIGTEYAVESDLRCVADEIETEADARLIAAAPELLAGCKAALGAFEHNHCIDWTELEDAIAKAEGRANKEVA